MDDDGDEGRLHPIASLPYVVTTAGRYRLVGDLELRPGGRRRDNGGRERRHPGPRRPHPERHCGRRHRGVRRAHPQHGRASRWRTARVQGFLAGVYLAGPPPTRCRPGSRSYAPRAVTRAPTPGSGSRAGATWSSGCEVVGTGGTTALDPGAGAVGISSVGAAPEADANQVRDTVATAAATPSGSRSTAAPERRPQRQPREEHLVDGDHAASS